MLSNNLTSSKSNIYILHYGPLTERKIFMDNQLNKQNINANYILEHDKEDITEDEKIIFDYNNKFTLSNSSLILKHIEAYKEIVINNQEFGLIIEDDVILDNNFNTKYYEYYKQLPEDWDILFYGNGYRNSMNVPKSIIKKNINVYLKSNKGIGNWSPEVKDIGWPVCSGSSRCSDCYIIKNITAKKILKYVDEIKIDKQSKIADPSDLWMNLVFLFLQFKVYWAEPSICTQGTENGTFKSSQK
jgi:GR25 family glycosyltransferase involved in LPS biosynthesis